MEQTGTHAYVFKPKGRIFAAPTIRHGPPTEAEQFAADHPDERINGKLVDWENDTIVLRLPNDQGVPVPISVWVTHHDFVGRIIQDLRPRIVVEVGVYTGASLLTIRGYCRYYHLDTQLFGIDSWRGATSGSEGWAWDGEKTYNTLRDRIKTYKNVHLLRLESEDGATCIPDGSVDLLHIDADHREPAIRHDLELWLPKVAPLGVVLLHDVGMVTDECQVWKVWREVQRDYPSITDTRACGLGAFCPRGVPVGLRDLIRPVLAL